MPVCGGRYALSTQSQSQGCLQQVERQAVQTTKPRTTETVRAAATTDEEKEEETTASPSGGMQTRASHSVKEQFR
ncbi:unnamed protein product [Soboliphyme baturini]|uniref:Uncharacterized protein n=1 Tax=Soboliphyme baturini TaxID=241478 RepID=A0A183IP44_9BILA|nr:unnamed protein product [Soboliphyme baturini]